MYVVYSKPACVQCDQAKMLLKTKGLSYREVMFDVGQPRVDGVEYVNVQEFKAQFPQAKMAPQIFVEGSAGLEHLGSLPELRARLTQ